MPLDKHSGKGDLREPDLRSWDAEFAALRRDSGFRWSTTLDRVLDLLWEEHSHAYDRSIRDPANRGRFRPQISPRALFLAALLYGARHQDDLRDRADDRGQTLIRVFRACKTTEARIFELLNREFFRQLPTELSSQDTEILSTELKAVVSRADNIRKRLGTDPYIGTRHLLLALLEAPKDGNTGDLIIRSGDEMFVQQIISAFRESVNEKFWVKKYEPAADWSSEFDGLENKMEERPVSPNFNPASEPQTQPPGIHIGGRTNFSKKAFGEEIVLGVTGYANVLAKLLRSSDENDLCLAIEVDPIF